MANEFKIQITAVDKATATINRINNSVSKMIRPAVELTRSVKRFSNASGMTNLGKSMGKAASEAGKLASTVGMIAAPLAAMVGGGTIAGVYELATAWGKLGAETGRTAEILGIGASELDAMRNSGRLFGITAESMTQTFGGFADTLQDARWGRNQKAAAMLQFLGIKLQTTKTGAIDAQAAMSQLADKIQRVQQRDPGAARKLAQSFGVEALLPVLIRGGAAWKAYQVEAERLSGKKTPEMIARAKEFAASITSMGVAIDGAKSSIGDKLIPVLDPLIKKWTEWLVLNRDPIGKKVAEIADKIAKAFAGIDLNKVLDGLGKLIIGCIDLAIWVVKVVDYFGGLKTVLITVGLVMVTSFVASTILSIAQLVILIAKLGMAAAAYTTLGKAAIPPIPVPPIPVPPIPVPPIPVPPIPVPPVAPAVLGASLASKALPFIRGAGGVAMMLHSGKLNSGEDDQVRKMNAGTNNAIKFFESKGWTHNQSSGIAANIERESSFNSHATGDKGAAYGYGQWHSDRQAQFKKLYGHSMQSGTDNEQLGFYDWELHNTEKAAGDRLAKTSGAGESAAVVSSMFERPRDKNGEMSARAQIANGMAQPQINVHVDTKVDSQGGVRTKVTTPQSVKIAYASPVNM